MRRHKEFMMTSGRSQNCGASSTAPEDLTSALRTLTAGIEYEMVVQFGANVSVAIFEPELVIGVMFVGLLVPHDHLGTALLALAFDVQDFAVHRALYEEVHHLRAVINVNKLFIMQLSC